MKNEKEGAYMNYPYQQQQLQQFYRPPQQVQYNWNQQPIPQVRPVSSIEEVKASQIDFDGSVFYSPDVANKKIYTKSINMDGTVNISMYELSQIKANQSMDSSCYITREEFEQVINKMYQEMSQTTAQQQKPQDFKF